MKNNRFAHAFKYIRTHTDAPYDINKPLSIADLARESGVSGSYIYQLEQENVNRTASNTVLKKLSNALGRDKEEEIDGIKLPTHEDFYNFFIDVSNGINPDPFLILKISNSLNRTEYKDFLQIVMGYPYPIDLDASDEEIAKEAKANWKKNEYHGSEIEEQLEQYKYLDSKLLLNKADDTNTEIILDNESLNEQEKVVLNSAIQTIRDLRKQLFK